MGYTNYCFCCNDFFFFFGKNESEIRKKQKKKRESGSGLFGFYAVEEERAREGGVCQRNVWIGKKKVCVCNVSMQESTGVCYCFAAG